MNAVFVLMWHEPGQDNGKVVGVFHRFVDAAAAGRNHVAKLIDEDRMEHELDLPEDEYEVMIMSLDAAGVPRMTDSEGRDGGECQIQEMVVQ